MSSPMTLLQFQLLMDGIDKLNHMPPHVKLNIRRIKYVYPSIDMRDGMVFAVRLKPWFSDEVVLHTQNECADLEESLYDRCLKFVKGED